MQASALEILSVGVVPSLHLLLAYTFGLVQLHCFLSACVLSSLAHLRVHGRFLHLGFSSSWHPSCVLTWVRTAVFVFCDSALEFPSSHHFPSSEEGLPRLL